MCLIRIYQEGFFEYLLRSCRNLEKIKVSDCLVSRDGLKFGLGAVVELWTNKGLKAFVKSNRKKWKELKRIKCVNLVDWSIDRDEYFALSCLPNLERVNFFNGVIVGSSVEKEEKDFFYRAKKRVAERRNKEARLISRAAKFSSGKSLKEIVSLSLKDFWIETLLPTSEGVIDALFALAGRAISCKRLESFHLPKESMDLIYKKMESLTVFAMNNSECETKEQRKEKEKLFNFFAQWTVRKSTGWYRRKKRVTYKY